MVLATTTTKVSTTPNNNNNNNHCASQNPVTVLERKLLFNGVRNNGNNREDCNSASISNNNNNNNNENTFTNLVNNDRTSQNRRMRSSALSSGPTTPTTSNNALQNGQLQLGSVNCNGNSSLSHDSPSRNKNNSNFIDDDEDQKNRDNFATLFAKVNSVKRLSTSTTSHKQPKQAETETTPLMTTPPIAMMLNGELNGTTPESPPAPAQAQQQHIPHHHHQTPSQHSHHFSESSSPLQLQSTTISTPLSSRKISTPSNKIYSTTTSSHTHHLNNKNNINQPNTNSGISTSNYSGRPNSNGKTTPIYDAKNVHQQSHQQQYTKLIDDLSLSSIGLADNKSHEQFDASNKQNNASHNNRTGAMKNPINGHDESHRNGKSLHGNGSTNGRDSLSPCALRPTTTSAQSGASVLGTTTPRSNSKSPVPNEALIALLTTLQTQNKNFVRQIEDLRIKLEDAEGDLKLVRCQMRTLTKQMDTVAVEAANERNVLDETLSNEIEFHKQKITLLEQETARLKQDKEKLERESQEERGKNRELNEHLLTMMRSFTAKQSTERETTTELTADLDALYLENRYLKDKIEQEEVEKRLLLDRLENYKHILEESTIESNGKMAFSCSGSGANGSTSKNNGSKSSFQSVQLPNGHRVTCAEIERLIDSNSGAQSLEVNKQNQMYLWNLTVAMFESLQSKNINLSQAQKTNRLLSQRIDDFECRSTPTPPPTSLPSMKTMTSSTPGATVSTTMSSRYSHSTHHSPHHTTTSPHRHLRLNTPRYDPMSSPKKSFTSKNTLLSVGHCEDSLSSASSPSLSKTDEILRIDSVETPSSLEKTISQESDEISSPTEISTPSTTRHSAMSIEKELEALQKDALADMSDGDYDACRGLTHFHHPHNRAHQYGNGSSKTGSSQFESYLIDHK